MSLSTGVGGRTPRDPCGVPSARPGFGKALARSGRGAWSLDHRFASRSLGVAIFTLRRRLLSTAVGIKMWTDFSGAS
jgi:hypothetical protein